MLKNSIDMDCAFCDRKWANKERGLAMYIVKKWGAGYIVSNTKSKRSLKKIHPTKAAAQKDADKRNEILKRDFGFI